MDSPPPVFRYWLPWAIAGLCWVGLYAVLYWWTGRMVADHSDRTAFGLVIVCLFTILAIPFLIVLARAIVPSLWLRRSLSRGAVLGFFLSVSAPAYLFLQSPRWQLYDLTTQAWTKVGMAEKRLGHRIPLATSLQEMTSTPGLARSNEDEINEIALASLNESILSVFAHAQHLGRGPTVGADFVVANGLARPKDIERLRSVGETLNNSMDEYDQALSQMIIRIPR